MKKVSLACINEFKLFPVTYLLFILFILGQNRTHSQIFTKVASPLNNYETTGCGWIDYNNDNKLDAFVSYFSNPCTITSYKGDGKFELITSSDIISGTNNFSGFSWGDYNNDGYPDLYITNMGGGNVLYKNLGDGHFQKILTSVVTRITGSFVSSNWVDYNNDGYLDLWVSACGTNFSAGGSGNQNLLFKNNGDGIFTRVTDNDLALTRTNTDCAAFADYDNDGYMDVFLTEWGKDNWLFKNNGDGTFTKITGTTVNSNSYLSITASWADYDNDGYMDLFVGNGSTSRTDKQTNYLFHNNGDGTFTKIIDGDIANYKGCVWTSAWGDVDNDGDLDLYAGTIYDTEYLLYINNGDGTFTRKQEFEISPYSFGTGVTGASFGDYDDDGFLDLLVANAGSNTSYIYHNNSNSNHWTSIECEGIISNKSAIGTRVKIKAKINGKEYWQIREITGVQGFRGSNDLRVHFGLGDAAVIDSLIINWPSKQLTVLTALPVNQILNVKENIPANFIQPRFKVDIDGGYSPVKVKFTDMSVFDESNPVTSWSWDLDGDGKEDSKDRNPEFSYYNYDGKSYNISLTISNGINTQTITKNNFIKIFPLYEQNLTKFSTVTASSCYDDNRTQPSNISDGNAGTYWQGTALDSEWIKIQLDSAYAVGKIVIRWSTYYAKHFVVQSSLNGNNWNDVMTIDKTNKSNDTLRINLPRARYFRFILKNNSTGTIGFRISELEIYRPEILTDIERVNEPVLPSGFELYQNYPNPFNPTTKIQYAVGSGSAGKSAISSEQLVTLKVYDILGNEVTTLVNEHKAPGYYEVEFSAGSLATGVYIYRLTAGEFTSTKKLMLMK